MATQEKHKGIYLITITGVVANILLLILSVIFAKERVLFLDSAVYMFEMINQECFFVPYYRFINVFNQFLPILGIQLHLPTNVLILLYSINIQLVFTAIFIVIAFVLQQKKLALSIPLLQLMLCFESFYLPISELALGIAFLILLIAYKNSISKPLSVPQKLLFLLLGFILIFSHPLIIIPIAIILFLEVMKTERKSLISNQFFLFLGSILAAIILLKLVSFQTYEAERSSDLISSIFSFSKYELVTSFYSISKYILHFPLFIFCGLIAIVLLVQSKKWRTLIGFASFGFLSIFGISLYMHKIYFIMPFFEIYLLIVVFFIIVILENLLKSTQQIVYGFVGILMLVQVGFIVSKASFFKERIAIYQTILDEMDSQNVHKAIVDFYATPMRKIYTMYDTPYASLLMSNPSKSSKNKVFTLFVAEDEIDMNVINKHKALLFLGFENRVHPPFPIKALNPAYFNVDTSAYQYMEIDFSKFE